MGILTAVVLLCVAVAGGITWSLRSSVKPDTRAAQAPVNPKSIAMLPFADISPDADQEFFADGMTVELITAVAPIGLSTPRISLWARPPWTFESYNPA